MGKRKRLELPPLEKFQPPAGQWFNAHVCSDELEALRILRAGKSIQAKGPDGTLAVWQLDGSYTCYLDIKAPGKIAAMTMQHNMPGALSIWLHIWWPWLGL
jgi:hypothetical protein